MNHQAQPFPTFDLERAQELLYYLHEGWKEKRLPSGMEVFLDSPMAISATNIFARHPKCYDEETKKLFADGHDPFDFPALHFTHEALSVCTNVQKDSVSSMNQ